MQLIGLEEKSRAAFLWSPPAADEVVDRYLRGYVLFGRETGRLAKLEWQSFDARAIATAETFKVPSRLRRLRRNGGLEVRFDQDFQEVAKACQEGRSDWTWLTDDLIGVYRMMHEQGLAATVGTYRDGRLVGGLLGLSIMSIFHRENHAGSVAMAALEDVVSADGRWNLIDFGNMTAHNERFGAFLVTEERFLELLQKN
jgi:leucyl/phenylalanyl-tRNA--protein transferase